MPWSLHVAIREGFNLYGMTTNNIAEQVVSITMYKDIEVLIKFNQFE